MAEHEQLDRGTGRWPHHSNRVCSECLSTHFHSPPLTERSVSLQALTLCLCLEGMTCAMSAAKRFMQTTACWCALAPHCGIVATPQHDAPAYQYHISYLAMRR